MDYILLRNNIHNRHRLPRTIEGIASIAAKYIRKAFDRIRARDADDGLVGVRPEGINCI